MAAVASKKVYWRWMIWRSVCFHSFGRKSCRWADGERSIRRSGGSRSLKYRHGDKSEDLQESSCARLVILAFKWPQWHTLLIEEQVTVDMRVSKMLLKTSQDGLWWEMSSPALVWGVERRSLVGTSASCAANENQRIVDRSNPKVMRKLVVKWQRCITSYSPSENSWRKSHLSVTRWESGEHQSWSTSVEGFWMALCWECQACAVRMSGQLCSWIMTRRWSQCMECTVLWMLNLM